METSHDLFVESFAARQASLRIALVTETFPPEINGVAMTLGRILDGLLARGHSVQVIRPRQSGENAVLPREGLEQVLSYGVALPAYRDLQFGLPARNRLTKLWSEQRPDIVHVATEGPLGWSAVTAARKLQLPITSSFHTNFRNYSPHYGIGMLKVPINAYLRKLHSRTLATMVPTLENLQELKRRGYSNLTLLSRGVSSDLFNPDRRSQALRDSWGVKPEDTVVLSVGRLAKEKNLGLVLSAFRSIQARLPSAKLVIVGDGPLRKSLEASYPQARFAGARMNEDLATHYASGDLFLFPSVTETYGNVVLEALASGLAVVSYACAAAKEIIANGDNGVLVVTHDEPAFVDACVALAIDAPKQVRLRAAAPTSVSHLSWDDVFDSFVATLTKVLVCHGRQFAATNTVAPKIA
ncbi:MAG: glycosyltransferase family 1 protein [Rhodoferax sp.]|uniref:glycosyltransferase family 4 protein n=1 Tax=Rhodoferax sp. TaxID=50421 RepID=UPI002733E34E|nr:glycosyltransferase family 1 protein [Rhodoferax sp.]MDP2680389.1 glycosyltransferase family 1 protein [Rhodoferax sp.]